MIQFDYKKIMKEKTVVHCKTEEQAVNLLKWADSKELKWNSGKSYLDKTYYSIHTDEMCYSLQTGSFANYAFYQENEYDILQYYQVVVDIDWGTKCKNCGQGYGDHTDFSNRCPLIDFEGGMADGYWGTTFFEAEESEVDKLIEKMENGDLFVSGDIHSGKLLKELKELRK